MKATSGRLSLAQGYDYIKTEYNGKHKNELTAVVWQCENCDRPIANIAFVMGQNDKKTYRIGLDCAATLTGIEGDKIAQAKKEMRQAAKLHKWIKEEMTFWIKKENQIELFHGDDSPRFLDRHTPRYIWRVTLAYAKELSLAEEKERTISPVGKYKSEYSDYEFTTYNLENPNLD